MLRYFTADFHLGFEALLHLEKWPFKSIEQHDAALVRSCKERTKPGDVIYHIGDLACYRQDARAKSRGLTVKPYELVKDIPATFINIRGNHDLHNKVKSACDSMHMFLSKRYPSVSLSHYPTYDARVDASCLHAPIHVCGHVHQMWRHCLDLDHRILNINVGCMAWGFKIVPEGMLTAYLDKLFKMQPGQLHRCHREGRDVVFEGSTRV